jgi:predicted PurR-regulated permease PerM
MENSNQYKSKQLFETILQLGLVFLILGFCFTLLLPFMMPILWAVILAIILYPAFNFLQKKTKRTQKSCLIHYHNCFIGTYHYANSFVC